MANTPNLPPINSNQSIVDGQGRPKSAFVLLINQLLKAVATSASTALATLLAKTIDTTTLEVTGTYGDQIHVDLKPLTPDPTGTYGDATHFAVVTLDEYGRVTAASEEPAAGAITVEDGTTSVADVSVLKFTSGAVVTAGATSGEADVAISGGGGGGGNLVKIAQVVVTAAQPTISFGSIPQTYDDLVLGFQIKGDATNTNINGLLQINGDTGANYDYFSWNRYGIGGPSFGQTSAIAFTTAPAKTSGTVDGMSYGDIELQNYSGTAAQRSITSSYGIRFAPSGGFGDDNFTVVHSCLWRSSAPVTSLLLSLGVGNFDVGTVVTLYGRGGPSSGGGGGGGMTLIDTVTAVGGEFSLEFAAIPGTYKNLLIMGQGGCQGASTTASGQASLEINGDTTGADYGRTMFGGFGAGTIFGLNTADLFLAEMGAAGVGAGTFRIDIPGYNNPGQITWMTECAAIQGNTGIVRTSAAGIWTGPGPVTDIKLNITTADGYSAGTAFELYGY